MGENTGNMCNKKFNLTQIEADRVRKTFYDRMNLFESSNCKIPCTQMKYEVKWKQHIKAGGLKVQISFDKTIDLTTSSFSVGILSVLSSLGGSVSIGRTVLWICLLIVAAPNALMRLRYFCSKC